MTEPTNSEIAAQLDRIERLLTQPRPGPCGVISRPLPLPMQVMAQVKPSAGRRKYPRICVLDADHNSDLHRSQDESLWSDGESWSREQYQQWCDERAASRETVVRVVGGDEQ